MNITSSLERIIEAGNLDANLILQHYKLDLMSRILEVESNNPKFTQKQLTQQLASSDSKNKRCRDQINMPSHYNTKGY